MLHSKATLKSINIFIAATIPRDCADWAAKGETLSGIFEINIDGEY